MKFLIHLTKGDKGSFLPLTYQYELSNAIYSILEKAYPEYSQFLHMDGFNFGGKGLKPFTFSILQFDDYQVHRQYNLIEHTGQHVVLDIRFTVDPKAEGFIKRIFMDQFIILGDQQNRVVYQVTRIETAPTVAFQEVMVYRCLSPIFILASGSDGVEEYLLKDGGFPKILKENLLSKLLNYFPEIQGLKELDNYCPEINFQLLNEPREKDISLRTFSEEPIKGIGYEFDFKVKASPILQELGYFGGFGSKNALGFGCVEVLS